MADRHAFRANWHDYNSGIYFVTICSHEKRHIFGAISKGEMIYSLSGEIVNRCLSAIPAHNNDVELWNSIVMPNHIHMVLAVGAQYFAPATNVAATKNVELATNTTPNTVFLRSPRHGEPCADNHFNSRLAVIVRSFKAACPIEINRQLRSQNIGNSTRAQNIAPLRVWQRNYHEHIIRNQRAYDNIMEYIDNNVINWNKDCFNKLQ